MVLRSATSNDVATHAEDSKVLFKRKPFTLLPTPPNVPENAEVLAAAKIQDLHIMLTRARTGIRNEGHRRGIRGLREISEEVLLLHSGLICGND